MRHNIHSLWIVDDVDYHACFISNDGNTTSALSHLTVDSNRSLESLSSVTMSCTLSDLHVLLVSTVLLDSSQLAKHEIDNANNRWDSLDIWDIITRRSYTAHMLNNCLSPCRVGHSFPAPSHHKSSNTQLEPGLSHLSLERSTFIYLTQAWDWPVFEGTLCLLLFHRRLFMIKKASRWY